MASQPPDAAGEVNFGQVVSLLASTGKRSVPTERVQMEFCGQVTNGSYRDHIPSHHPHTNVLMKPRSKKQQLSRKYLIGVFGDMSNVTPHYGNPPSVRSGSCCHFFESLFFPGEGLGWRALVVGLCRLKGEVRSGVQPWRLPPALIVR